VAPKAENRGETYDRLEYVAEPAGQFGVDGAMFPDILAGALLDDHYGSAASDHPASSGASRSGVRPVRCPEPVSDPLLSHGLLSGDRLLYFRIIALAVRLSRE